MSRARLLFSLPLCTLCVVGSGCVIGRQTRPTLAESAQGHTSAPVAGSPVLPQSSTNDDEARPPAKPGSLWVKGYWHWDGVSYVWQRGHWEQRPL